jgi:Rrf2 family transcriptional regulator, iron-sulfur cluster assembly transcription factor
VELNTKGRYAVTAMADLAKFSVGGAIPLSAISERQHISLSYLEQLFVKLRRAGLVESARGRAGGYRLARPADRISVAEIMRAVDEGVRMTRCAGEDAAPCVPGQRCLTHGLWDALGEQIAWFLDSVTLEEVIGGIAPSKVGRGLETGSGSDPARLPMVFQHEGRGEGSDPVRPLREGADPFRTDPTRIGGR